MLSRNVIINFFTKTQTKGLDQLGRSTFGLDKKFKSLRRTMLRYAGIGAIFAMLSRALRGFIDEGKEIKRLEILLNNLNKGFQSVAVEEFLGRVQTLTGVLDDQLRPAFARLLRELKNIGASQSLLNIAIDVSRGTGQDLETIVTALTRAFNGNNTQLKRLQIGLSKAALEGKDFSVVLGELEKLYGGAGEDYLNTYAGKMDLLKTRLDEAGEVLAKGILDGLTKLGEGDLDRGLQKVVDFAELAASGFVWLGERIRDVYDWLVKLGLIDTNEDEALRRRSLERYKAFQEEQKNRKELERLAKLSAARAAALERQRKAKKAAEEAADRLKKRLEAKFDIENINLAAAAQRNLSETDRSRVEALQALKTEGVKDDEAALNKLIELEKKREAEIQRQARESIVASAAVKNQRLADLQAELDALVKLSQARAQSITGTPVKSQDISAPPLQIEPTIPTNIAEAFIALSLAGQAEQQGAAALSAATAVGQQITVIQNIQGNVTTERELFDNYVDAIFQINRQGTNSQLVNLGR